MASLIYFNRWQCQTPPICSVQHKGWLTRPGALTAGLRQLGRFSLQVICEDVELARTEDKCFKTGTLNWRREVLMSIDEMPCVLARSVTTLRASHGVWQGIRRLERRPLADILYNEPGIVRSRFEISRVGRAQALHGTVVRARHMLNGSGGKFAATVIDREAGMFARRSFFWRFGEPLMVSECFLPEFWALTGDHKRMHRDDLKSTFQDKPVT